MIIFTEFRCFPQFSIVSLSLTNIFENIDLTIRYHVQKVLADGDLY